MGWLPNRLPTLGLACERGASLSCLARGVAPKRRASAVDLNSDVPAAVLLAGL
jgi:hypothetical protein